MLSCNPTKSLLCIDDQLTPLMVRKQFLETFGFAVMIATSGEEGLAIVKEHAIDAVLLDYRLYGLGCDATAIALRQLRPKLPIILLTGYVDSVTPAAREAVDMVISKTASTKHLMLALQDRLGGGCKPKWDVQREFPRYDIDVPVEIEVLRGSGITSVPGTCRNISEGGLSVVTSGILSNTEVVTAHLKFPGHSTQLQVRAIVRSQIGVQFGLEFTALNDEQRDLLRRYCEELPLQPGLPTTTS